MSDNEIYLLIKYIKSVLWRVVKRLSYIEDARCLKVKLHLKSTEKFSKHRSNLLHSLILDLSGVQAGIILVPWKPSGGRIVKLPILKMSGAI